MQGLSALDPGFVSRRLRAAALLLAATTAPAAGEPPVPLVTLSVEARDAPVVERQSYNYAPAVVRDGDLLHLYWCAGVAGDYVLHAQARDLAGPWRGAGGAAFDTVLAPSGAKDRFDGQHACDPSVLKIGARWYVYYGGLAAPGALTAIGVAAGDDPVHVQRLNDGRPIVVAAETDPAWRKKNLTYGAGQPAVVHRPPYVYLAFTDSTGAGGNRINGAGQYVLRSKDPGFATGVQEFTSRGWEDRPFGRHTAERSILESFGIDWAWDEASDTLVAAGDREAGVTSVFALDPESFALRGTGSVPLAWREGPALLADADRRLPPRPICASMDVAVFAAAGPSADPFGWHALHYSRAALSMAPLCPARPAPTP